MRRSGIGTALAAAVGLMLMACAMTSPDVVPDGDAPVTGGTYDDASARAVLIHEAEGDIPEQSVADWYDEAGSQAPDAFDPVSCRNSVSPVLLYDRDAGAAGTVYRPATVEREYDGATVTANQFARLFESDAEAEAFLRALRADREACPVFEIEGTRVGQSVLDGDFSVAAVGFAFDVTSPDGSSNGAIEWVLRDGNLVLALGGVGASVERLAPLLERIVEEYAERLA